MNLHNYSFRDEYPGRPYKRRNTRRDKINKDFVEY